MYKRQQVGNAVPPLLAEAIGQMLQAKNLELTIKGLTTDKKVNLVGL